jgi:hypothetical protein
LETLDVALLLALWPVILPHFLKLERNMQVGTDPEELEFAQWLCQLARGEPNNADDTVIIPPNFWCPNSNIIVLIKATYPNIGQPHGTDYF